MNNLPKHFYRYTSLDGRSALNVERVICHSEIYFSKPASFNDPFDCRPSFKIEGSDEEFYFYTERLCKKYMRDPSPEELQKAISSKICEWKCPEGIKAIRETHIKKITENIGVLCLSEKNDDILMWSHYANKHQGICLEFDSKIGFFAQAMKVEYRKERPYINPILQDEEKMMEIALLTKSKNWEYEHEWRVIDYPRGPGLYSFPVEALTSVILGAQVSSIDEEKIVGWIVERASSVKMYRALTCDETFSVKIKEIGIVRKMPRI